MRTFLALLVVIAAAVALAVLAVLETAPRPSDLEGPPCVAPTTVRCYR